MIIDRQTDRQTDRQRESLYNKPVTACKSVTTDSYYNCRDFLLFTDYDSITIINKYEL